MTKLSYLRIFSLFFVTWFIFSLTNSQIIPYMTYMGFSESMRSWVFTSSALVGMGAQLLIGFWSDKNQKTKIYFIVAMCLLLLTSALGFSVLQTPASFYFLCISIFIALFRVAGNLVETWTFQINTSVMKRFGLIRIFGSLGWALGSIVTAYLIEKYSYHVFPYWIAVLGAVILLLAFGIVDSQKVANPSSLKFSQVKELFQNTQFTISVAIFFILFLVYTLESLTLIDKMLEINSTNQQIGLLWSFQALVEIPLMIMGFKYIEKYGPRKILIITGIAFALRYILYGLAGDGNQIILISALQFITYPFMLLSQKVMVNLTTPIHLRASGHMVMTGITSNIPIVIVPLLSAFLHRYISYSAILIGAGILCALTVFLSIQINDYQINSKQE